MSRLAFGIVLALLIAASVYIIWTFAMPHERAMFIPACAPKANPCLAIDCQAQHRMNLTKRIA